MPYREHCPICGHNKSIPLFSWSGVPVYVNMLSDTKKEARNFTLGTQSLVQCGACGFVYNCEFEPEKLAYAVGYHAERACSPYYLRHMKHIVEFIESVHTIKGQCCLEVACGTGEFLRQMIQYRPERMIGVDPSVTADVESPIEWHQILFDEMYLAKMERPVDVLVSRHMIEHILNPLNMLRLFHQALANDGILYLETPRLEWILENNAFFDFPYEHCGYFSDHFMIRLLQAAGFEIAAQEFCYDGQYFAICAKKNAVLNKLASVSEEEVKRLQNASSSLVATLAYMNQSKTVQNFCEKIGGRDGLYFWGAAAKGVMCANLLNQWPISGFIDKNPFKQGKFIPGTAHSVIAPLEIEYADVKMIVVTNEVYLPEIRSEVQKMDSRILVLPLRELY